MLSCYHTSIVKRYYGTFLWLPSNHLYITEHYQPLAINFSHRPKAQFLDGLCVYFKLNQLQDNDYIKLESISNNIEVFSQIIQEI